MGTGNTLVLLNGRRMVQAAGTRPSGRWQLRAGQHG